MMRKWLVFSLLLFLVSCSNSDQVPEKQTVFRYNEFSNITSLDPAFAKDQANIWACNQLFNGLVQLDEKLHIQPCIAKEWQIDSSGKVYRFILRNDVYFHDHPAFPGGTGRRVNARDFVFSFNRIVDPALASPGAWVFNKVQKYESGYAFTAINDSTLEIRLKEPFPPFLGILTMIYCSVIPEEIFLAEGGDFRRKPVGTGPFRFKMWKENVKLVMVSNQRYFETENGHRLPFLDAVSISFLADKQAAFLEFVKGNIDMMSGLDQSYKDELLTKDGHLKQKYTQRYSMLSTPFLNTEYVGMLVDSTIEAAKNSPVRNRKVRQALNLGFDRVKMIRYLRNNIGYPGLYGILPPGFPAFDTNSAGYSYDPGKAKQLLKEAGYSNPAEIPVITLHTTAEYVDLFKFMQHQWEDIGFRINIEINPAATLMQMKAYSRVDFFRASWIADYPDEENYLSLFTSSNLAPLGPNYTLYHNGQYDSLYDKSQKTTDEAERINLYKLMNRKIIDDAPVIVLYYDQAIRFTQKNILGLGINPLNLLSLKRVKKIEDEYATH